MKVLIELPEKTLKALDKEAKISGRSRKKHMEIILIESSKPQLHKQQLSKIKK